MKLLSLLSLILAVFGRQQSSPCDCFDVTLSDNYPRLEGYNEICYKYDICKVGSSRDCPQSLEYFVLDAGELSCDISLSDMPNLITYSDDDDSVIAPFTQGRFDGTYTNGIKIIQHVDDDATSFTICFDASVVEDTQARGLIGLKDSNGNGDQCIVYYTVPDFCPDSSGGGNTPSDPTTTENNLPCTNNVRDSRFSCDCFNLEPDVGNACPRTVCVFDFYGDELCTDLPPGGSGPIPNGDPIQCTLAGFDECEDVSVCIDAPSDESYCVPATFNGVDFGCCKNYPRTSDDYESTIEPDSVTINPLLNDVDPDGDQLSIVDLGEPDNGGSVRPGLGDTVIYTPSTDRCRQLTGFWNYQDSFTYTVEDTDGLENMGTVFITVDCSRESPRAYDDDLSVNEGDENVSTDPLNGPGYDSDPDGDDDDLIINRIVSGPSLGIARITSDNKDILYTPNNNACDGRGDAQIFDQFDYNLIDIEDDNLISNSATVFITIFCSNDDPEPPTLDNLQPNAVDDDSINVNENDQNIPLRVLDNDSDPDGNPLTVSQITTYPRLGSAQITPDGSDIFYTVNSGACYRENSETLIDTLKYTAFDGNLVSNIATVTIYIKCNPAPFVMPRRSSSSSDDGHVHHHHGVFGLWGHRTHHGSVSSSNDGHAHHHTHGLLGWKSHWLWGGNHHTSHHSSSSSGRTHWNDFRDDREFEVVVAGSRNKPLWNAQSVNSDVINDNDNINFNKQPEEPVPVTPSSHSAHSLDKFRSYIIIGIITVIFNLIAYLGVYQCCIKQSLGQYMRGKVIDEEL